MRNAKVKLWTLKVRWWQSVHLEKMELKGRSYAALVKVGFCDLKCVYKIIHRSKWAVSNKNVIE